MSSLFSRRRGAAMLALALAATISSYDGAGAILLPGPEAPSDEAGLPQALTLLAPFPCDTEWRGSTYPGHGSHNWNLDLNRVGDHGEADLGQPVLAQGSGTVVWFKQTGYNRRAGTYVEVDYGEVTVRYLHLVEGSIPDEVAEIGARVRTGDRLGLLGATGRVSAPHLHLEYWNSTDFDDAAWYQIPRGNHLPVAFDGQEMIATPGRPSETTRSTNCVEPARDDERVERGGHVARLRVP